MTNEQWNITKVFECIVLPTGSESPMSAMKWELSLVNTAVTVFWSVGLKHWLCSWFWLLANAHSERPQMVVQIIGPFHFRWGTWVEFPSSRHSGMNQQGRSLLSLLVLSLEQIKINENRNKIHEAGLCANIKSQSRTPTSHTRCLAVLVLLRTPAKQHPTREQVMAHVCR